MPAKVLVIGLDGATMNVIETLASKDKMPTLSRLMKEGSYGKLWSTHPPSSSVAWPSFMTGKNPGKHSIFYFNNKHYGKYYSEPVTSKNIKSITLWEELSRENKKVAAINVPMTYPPRKINGMMVTGLGTPVKATHYTYPQELTRELEDAKIGKPPEVRWTEYTNEKIPQFIKDITTTTKRTYEIASQILQKEMWDFLTVVFTGTDRIQHRLWSYMDYKDPGFKNKIKNDKNFSYISELVETYFAYLDHLVSKLIKEAGGDPVVVMMSDHGSGKYSGIIDFNNLLSEWGYLKYNEQSKASNAKRLVKSIAKKIGINASTVKKIIKMSGKKFDLYKHLESNSIISNNIDWEHTKAFCFNGDGIYINVKNRERYGIVEQGTDYEAIRDELISHLLEFKNPLTGEHVVSEIKRKEDVYSGEFLDCAPDLILTEYDESIDFGNLLFSNERNRSILIEADNIHQGTHRFAGFYAFKGEGIKKNFRYDNAHITDLFPTILNLLDVGVPEDLDGKVLVGILSDPNKEIKYNRVCSEFDSSQDDVTEEEKELIIEELKGLGYM